MIRAAALLVLTALPALAEPAQPAELPPPDYAGLQYVDSKGCMFVRAGAGGEVLWIPRVSRQGVPVCGNPPSGRRVPVAEEVGVQPVTVPRTDSASATAGAPDSYYVDVGSFPEADKAARAEDVLKGLEFGVVRARVQDGSATLITLYAGPFDDASAGEAARASLVGRGFPEARLVQP